MAIAGRVAIVPKGDWSAETEYKRLDEVTYNNTMFIAKKAVPKGTLPTNAEYWSKSIVGGAGAIATKEDAGNVKPADGLSIAEDGTLKVSIDGTTLTMDQVNNVIKLADTLKEKINGAFPAANVVNNQITTETGYALDARQANPNIDGTLARQLSDLNGSLNNAVITSCMNIGIHKKLCFDFSAGEQIVFMWFFYPAAINSVSLYVVERSRDSKLQLISAIDTGYNPEILNSNGKVSISFNNNYMGYMMFSTSKLDITVY